MNSKARYWIPWLIVPVSVAVAIGCGGGGGGGTPPPPTCTADTTDTGDGSGTIIGGVVRDESGALVPNAVVQFYNSAGTLLKNALTSCTGVYRVNMGDVPARVTVKTSSIQATYYSEFQYQGTWYTTAANCRAPLTGININGTNTIATIYLQTKIGPPPPPPTGCL